MVPQRGASALPLGPPCRGRLGSRLRMAVLLARLQRRRRDHHARAARGAARCRRARRHPRLRRLQHGRRGGGLGRRLRRRPVGSRLPAGRLPRRVRGDRRSGRLPLRHHVRAARGGPGQVTGAGDGRHAARLGHVLRLPALLRLGQPLRGGPRGGQGGRPGRGRSGRPPQLRACRVALRVRPGDRSGRPLEPGRLGQLAAGPGHVRGTHRGRARLRLRSRRGGGGAGGAGRRGADGPRRHQRVLRTLVHGPHGLDGHGRGLDGVPCRLPGAVAVRRAADGGRRGLVPAAAAVPGERPGRPGRAAAGLAARRLRPDGRLLQRLAARLGDRLRQRQERERRPAHDQRRQAVEDGAAV